VSAFGTIEWASFGSAGALVVDAGSRAEVVAMALEDPAVKAKMVEFEVLGE
jgi:hypothetical protein